MPEPRGRTDYQTPSLLFRRLLVRTLGLGVVAACLLLVTGAARAQDEQAAVRDILDKATKALGGAEKAAKFSDVTCKAKASFSEGGTDISISADLSLQGFDRM